MAAHRWWWCVAEKVIFIVFLIVWLHLSTAERLHKYNYDRTCNSTEPGDVTFVILSQDTAYHSTLAHQLRTSIRSQAVALGGMQPQVYTVPEDMTSPGAWTLLPLFSVIRQRSRHQITWVMFCKETTRIYLKRLLDVLTRHACSGEKWLGYRLVDRRPAAPHHYAAANVLPYPFAASGFAISMTLVDRMSRVDLASHSSFSIDPYYEIAEAIYRCSKIHLTPEAAFCINYGENCATATSGKNLCKPVSTEQIFFAIKTFEENHLTRARILKSSSLRRATHYRFFSDVNDTSLPATDTGIPNTLVGHCQKTINILHHLQRIIFADYKERMFKWIVLTDDDTIISVQGVVKILGCFTSENGPIMIGERYGYGFGNGKIGYDYITGGGGIAMNAKAVSMLSSCRCPSANTPDDMWLGACAQQNMIKIIHSEAFHQAQPKDYAMEYLSWTRPVSFHKLDLVDPYSTYNEWFKEENLQTLSHYTVRLCRSKESSNKSRD